MAQLTKEIFEKRIIFLWQNAIKSNRNIKQTISKPFKYFSTELGSFFLNEAGISCLSSILYDLRESEDVGKKFSNTYLENAIKDLIIELLPIPSKNIVNEVQVKSTQFFAILLQPEIDWVIINAIENLHLGMKFLEVGTVRFGKFSKNQKKKMMLHQGKKMRALLKEKVLPSFDNKTIASVCVSAVDEARAQELGRQAITEAIDILRFYRLNPKFRNVSRNNIGISGQLHKGTSITLCFKKSEKPKHIAAQFEHTGFLYPFQIDASGLKAIRDDCFKILCEISKKRNGTTDFEKRILSGVRFCALSIEDETLTNSLVNGVVSLEAFLLTGREPKAGTLAERVALIVGTNLLERNWLFDQMLELYKIRSEIVHAGYADIPQSSLRLLQVINYTCIIKLLKLSRKKKFNTVSDLINWCRFKKFK